MVVYDPCCTVHPTYIFPYLYSLIYLVPTRTYSACMFVCVCGPRRTASHVSHATAHTLSHTQECTVWRRVLWSRRFDESERVRYELYIQIRAHRRPPHSTPGTVRGACSISCSSARVMISYAVPTSEPFLDVLHLFMMPPHPASRTSARP